jgi:hypothetical protein
VRVRLHNKVETFFLPVKPVKQPQDFVASLSFRLRSDNLPHQKFPQLQMPSTIRSRPELSGRFSQNLCISVISPNFLACRGILGASEDLKSGVNKAVKEGTDIRVAQTTDCDARKI